jgi:hypothetical protein
MRSMSGPWEANCCPGVHRDTIRKALASPMPPSYGQPSKRPWKLRPVPSAICERLADEATLSGVCTREELKKLSYDGSKAILDDLLRELRPRFLPPPRSFHTRYRPGDLVQFDLCEPRAEIPVGWAGPTAPTRGPSLARWRSPGTDYRVDGRAHRARAVDLGVDPGAAPVRPTTVGDGKKAPVAAFLELHRWGV